MRCQSPTARRRQCAVAKLPLAPRARAIRPAAQGRRSVTWVRCRGGDRSGRSRFSGSCCGGRPWRRAAQGRARRERGRPARAPGTSCSSVRSTVTPVSTGPSRPPSTRPVRAIGSWWRPATTTRPTTRRTLRRTLATGTSEVSSSRRRTSTCGEWTGAQSSSTAPRRARPPRAAPLPANEISGRSAPTARPMDATASWCGKRTASASRT